MSSTPEEILVVCIGNDLAGDDGAGFAVYERLQAMHMPETVELLHLGLGGMALLDYLTGQKLVVVVDAVQLNGIPGTVHVIDWDRIPRNGKQAVSLHGISFLDTLEIAWKLYPDTVPDKAVLVGIEGSRFNELGVPLTNEVAAAIHEAAEQVRQQILRITEGSRVNE
jgi:hydrogenase maturation protease